MAKNCQKVKKNTKFPKKWLFFDQNTRFDDNYEFYSSNSHESCFQNLFFPEKSDFLKWNFEKWSKIPKLLKIPQNGLKSQKNPKCQHATFISLPNIVFFYQKLRLFQKTQFFQFLIYGISYTRQSDGVGPTLNPMLFTLFHTFQVVFNLFIFKLFPLIVFLFLHRLHRFFVDFSRVFLIFLDFQLISSIFFDFFTIF